jgi:ABC-type transporter Mla subunit MlaD
MAENSGSGGAGMGVIVGALLVLVIVIVAFLAFGGGMFGGQTKKVDVNVQAPDISAPKAP